MRRRAGTIALTTLTAGGLLVSGGTALAVLVGGRGTAALAIAQRTGWPGAGEVWGAVLFGAVMTVAAGALFVAAMTLAECLRRVFFGRGGDHDL